MENQTLPPPRRFPSGGIRLPSLVDMPLPRAKRILALYGLKLSLQLVERPGPLNTVFGQLPEPGARVYAGDEIKLSVRQESPIQYLPEIFQLEDERTRDAYGHNRLPELLRRFLLLTQHTYSGLEQHVESLPELFDPARTPRRLLPWLARLIPLELDASWSTDKVRQVLLQAPTLLARRGTAEGLEAMIRLYFELPVKVYENAWPHRGVVVGRSRVGGLVCVSTVPPPEVAFYVEVPADAELDPATWERLLRLIDREKPAQLRACVVRAPASRTRTAGDDDASTGPQIVGRQIIGKSTHSQSHAEGTASAPLSLETSSRASPAHEPAPSESPDSRKLEEQRRMVVDFLELGSD